MDISRIVLNSSLYAALQRDDELRLAVCALRELAARLADTISRTVPTFTDHSIRHMDALWAVADRILSHQEFNSISSGEAFLLASGFYLHDIGMAYAATSEGLARIRSSPTYTGIISAAPPSERANPATQARALAAAVRQMHASAAVELATTTIPGTQFHLFEAHSIRDAWGETAGRVAASHHWSLERVERELGVPGVVALPGGRKGDLGYVAGILRLVDYAHINRDRAPRIDRALRQDIEGESLVHWLAQEQIDGPERDGNELVYRSSGPISDVDAWWLYYEMLVGLDAEIRAVKRYFDRRASSKDRLSLQGVRGTSSPEEGAAYIATSGFLPIEVNLRTGAIDRLVQLLAGETLYGPDPMAAVRELIQNSRDAMMLKSAVASSDLDKAALALPIRLALKTSVPQTLEITDWGIGMTRKVITDYLLSIASDYWATQYHQDFPNIEEQKFSPAGKFGIGFLSVFMLGNDLAVESNRDGGERCRLSLRGVGRRGEIRTVPAPSGSGTSIRINLKSGVADAIKALPDLVRIYAPMLPYSLQVDVDGRTTAIASGWWRSMPTDQFHQWATQAARTLFRNREGSAHDVLSGSFWMRRFRYAERPERSYEWPIRPPEYSEDRLRLIASFESTSLLCLKGLALQPTFTNGFVGLIDSDSLTPDVSRSRALDAEVQEIIARATRHIRAQIVENLNALGSRGPLVNELDFLTRCVRAYGREPLLESSLAWISLIKMPGDVNLISSADFLTRLIQSRSLYMVFNTGPWTAMKHWGEATCPEFADEPAIVLDDAQGGAPPYLSSHEGTKTGSLDSLWPGNLENPLFATIIGMTAEAWQVNVDYLSALDTWHHRDSTLWGRLTRP